MTAACLKKNMDSIKPNQKKILLAETRGGCVFEIARYTFKAICDDVHSNIEEPINLRVKSRIIALDQTYSLLHTAISFCSATMGLIHD